MRFIRSQSHLLPNPAGSVITVGNFDGVHLGHQMLIKRVVESAKLKQMTSVVMIFEPHPKAFFMHDIHHPRVYQLRDKLRALENLGVDQVVCLKFDHALSQLSAEDFVADILLKGLNVKQLVLGDDFRFGHGRVGDIPLLKNLGSMHHFGVEVYTKHCIGAMPVSSTLIRKSLAQGHMEQVKEMLGKPYTISGRVRHGDQLGQSIGFATVNVRLMHQVALSGIFAVTVEGLEEHPVLGAGYVGTRPTVGGTVCQLEVHCLDYQKDCYGALIQVHFHTKIRDDHQFDSLGAMQIQMSADVDAIRQYFKQDKLTRETIHG